MIQSNFQIAFKIEVLHSYFEQNICNCLQFNPGAITRGLLKRFDLKIRKKTNGFDFYINSNTPPPAFFNYITSATGKTFFDFEIRTDDQKFSLFTELPLDWVGRLLYDSHAESNCYQEDVVQLGEHFSENESTTHLGNLVIHFDDIIKYRSDERHAKFNICYKARSTQWQYFVVNKSAVQLDNPAITSKTGINFNDPVDVIIETGQRALLFSSGDSLIPLSEIPGHKFDLVNKPPVNEGEDTKKSFAPKIIFKGLPKPDPGRIKVTGINSSKQVLSPMYIFI